MTTTAARTAPVAPALALALVIGLAGCTGGTGEPAGEPTPTATPSPSAGPTETPPASPEPTPEPTPADALPAGFPDPAGLVGLEAFDEQGADGTWHTVVGGEPLDLTLSFGACFDGGTGDVCAYSISGHAPAGPDGAPGPAEAALLLLLRATGHMADGTPTWEVLDALVTRTPDGAPALLEPCDGAPGVAFYPVPGAAASSTIPVAAAWGPDPAVTALVEVGAASISCAYVGD